MSIDCEVELLMLKKAEVEYIPKFLSKDEADDLFLWCKENLPFSIVEVMMFGKRIPQPRKTCVVGIKEYSYSGATLKGIEMPSKFEMILDRLKHFLPEDHPRPNVVLCNYYEDGKEYIGAHSDTEKDFRGGCSISGLSLGAVRHFDFADKAGEEEKVRIDLAHGSMVIMGRGTQTHYKHSVPKQMKIKEPRISLTFRVVG